MMTAAAAPLGLDAFAGIVDDEGIEMRQRPEHRLGQAILRQAGALARQPFEVAVLAEMDDRVRVERASQPQIEGEIVVRRDEIGIVIAGFRIDVVAARRLDADDEVAEAMQAERESAVDDMRVLLGAAPSRG